MNSYAPHLIEMLLARHFSIQYHEPFFVAVGNFKHWDFSDKSRNFSVECKLDTSALESENLCIEISYRDQPSGINATRAELWIHVVPIDQNNLLCYEFTVDTLKLAVKALKLITGGDQMRSEMKLLPIKEAELIARRVFPLRIDWDEFKPYW